MRWRSVSAKQNRKSLKLTVQKHRNAAPGELLLEQITSEQLLGIRGRAQKIREYHSRMFFELEGQRSVQKEQILAALQHTGGISVKINGWCRAIRAQYWSSPLSCQGSLKSSGRFNFGRDIDEQRFPVFPALYVASNRATAHCEMFGITHVVPGAGLSDADLVIGHETSLTYLALTGEIHNVFDLSMSDSLNRFIKVTSKFRLTSDLRKMERQMGLKPTLIANSREVLMRTFLDPSWRAFLAHVDVPANSQVFGQLVSAAGFEGIRYKSIRTGDDNLVIFPRNFRNSLSNVMVNDNSEHYLNADNYQLSTR